MIFLKTFGFFDKEVVLFNFYYLQFISAFIYYQIESALPTLSKPIMSLDANEDAIPGTLKQSLRQLETLGDQRAGLEDMLKDMKRKVYQIMLFDVKPLNHIILFNNIIL
ncbi:hypothetical protein Hanom_Chr02g00121861 [Helianthus anomalus]